MPFSRTVLAEVTVPLTRLIRVGAGRWVDFCSGDKSGTGEKWANLPNRYRVFFDKQLQAYFSVDMAEWYGRLHYFTGRYFEQNNYLVLQRFLRPGSTFVDIGAHYGIHTLTASHMVGPTGRVIAFEPNPPTYRVLESHIWINRRRNITAHNVGVSDTAGELSLSGDDSSRLSFRFGDAASNTTRVPVVITDELLEGLTLPGRLLVKIDTEGFEHRAIRGLRKTMERADIGLTVEITDKWLRETGSSSAELFSEMTALGFATFFIEVRHGRLHLTPLAAPRPEWQYDVLFAKPAFLSGDAASR